MENAQRVSYRLFVGDIPDGLHVLHRCDNPPCVNPAHLWLGTPADNARDRGLKGRYRAGPPMRGADSPSAKLTAAQVTEIRRVYIPGDATFGLAALARAYGVTKSPIWHIVHRTTWKEIAQ